MCGIIGYIGKTKDIREGLEALKRLEYRGYDSAGMAAYDPREKEVVCVKAVGKIVNLEKKLEGVRMEASPFLFYTRWATHGGSNRTKLPSSYRLQREYLDGDSNSKRFHTCMQKDSAVEN